jgi:formylglycine-generating enzyme required for sulfatase activity
MKDDLLPFYKEREFTLNTTPERFATWLQKHVKAGLVTPPGAKIHIGIAQFTPPPNIGPTARLKIHGYVEKPDPEEDGAYLRSHLPGLIQFELVPSLTIEGVEVRAECHDPALIEYFDELLAKIERSATLTLTRGSADDKRFGEIPTRRENMDWDVFISHAWEDKEDIARPLAEALRRKGLRVWYDEFTLTLGDSLRRSIDRGLAQSRYGVVILSPNFFAKEWPQKELDGLAAREVSGEKVVLPIWHNVTVEQVREYSPTLADRVAVSSDRGLEHVVKELLRVIKPVPELVLPAVLGRVQPFEPEMILIPAGEFLMGSDPRIDKDARDDERPQHILYLSDYYLAKTPVTNIQYAAFVQATGYKQPEHWEDAEPPGDKLEHPVVNVSWYDAVAYCRWLSKITGRPYCLPSEAEWEKGARGSDGRIYPWGNQWDAERCNAGEGSKKDTTPVGAYPKGISLFGLLDMAGNVWEWTRSWWGKGWGAPDFKYPYDPTDGREDLDVPNSVVRMLLLYVLRGGAFDFIRGYVRCAARYSYYSRHFYGSLGFRVCVASQQD